MTMTLGCYIIELLLWENINNYIKNYENDKNKIIKGIIRWKVHKINLRKTS